jgi:hypothetical protein
MTTFSPKSMKLHLLLLVSLVNLSSGFMAMVDLSALREPLSDLLLLHSVYSLSSGYLAELRGPCTEETCTVEEYAEEAYYNSRAAATLGAESEADPTLPVLAELEQETFVNRGGEGQQSGGGRTRSGVPRETFFVGRHISEGGRTTIVVHAKFPSLPPFFQHRRFARSKDLTTRPLVVDLYKLFSKRLSKAIFVLLSARLYRQLRASRHHPGPNSRPSFGNNLKQPEL